MGSRGAWRPDAAAHASSAAPDGMRRHAATSSGVVCGASCFIATMEVPQKKKGDTSSSVSSTCASGPVRQRRGWVGGWVGAYAGRKHVAGPVQAGRSSSAHLAAAPQSAALLLPLLLLLLLLLLEAAARQAQSRGAGRL